MKVKKGDILAVIEHNDMKAMLASRQAQCCATRRSSRSPGRPEGEGARGTATSHRLFNQKNVPDRGDREGDAGRKKAAAPGGRPGGRHQADAGQRPGDRGDDPHDELYAPFDGTVVEKQGEEGEIITPSAMSSSIGRTAVVTLADLEQDGRRDRRRREPALAGRARPARRDLRQSRPVEALPRPAPAGDPDGRPDPRHGQGQGRDPRPRRQALPRARGHRPLPPQQGRRTAPTPAARSCSSPSRRSSRRTGTTMSGSSVPRTSLRKRPVEVAVTTRRPGAGRVGPRRPASRSSSTRRRSVRDEPRRYGSGSPNCRLIGLRLRLAKGSSVHGRDALRSSCAVSTRNTGATSSASPCSSISTCRSTRGSSSP